MSRGPIGTPAEEQREANAATNQAVNETNKAISAAYQAMVAQRHAANEQAEAIKSTENRFDIPHGAKERKEWEANQRNAAFNRTHDTITDIDRSYALLNSMRQRNQAKEDKAPSKAKKSDAEPRKAPDKVIEGKGLDKPSEEKSTGTLSRGVLKAYENSPEYIAMNEKLNAPNREKRAKMERLEELRWRKKKDTQADRASYSTYSDLMAHPSWGKPGLSPEEEKELEELEAWNKQPEASNNEGKTPEQPAPEVFHKAEYPEAKELTAEEKAERSKDVITSTPEQSALQKEHLDKETADKADKAKRKAEHDAVVKANEDAANADRAKKAKEYQSKFVTRSTKAPSDDGNVDLYNDNDALEGIISGNTLKQQAKKLETKTEKFIPGKATPSNLPSLEELKAQLHERALALKSQLKGAADTDKPTEEQPKEQEATKPAKPPKYVPSKQEEQNAKEARALFSNKDAAGSRKGNAGMQLYHGDSLYGKSWQKGIDAEGKPIMSAAGKQQLQGLIDEKNAGLANEAINIEELTNEMSRLDRLLNVAKANGYGDDDPQVQNIKNRRDHLGSLLSYSDNELAKTLSDYRRFTQNVAKGGFNAFGDFSRFKPLNLTPEQVREKFPLRPYVYMRDLANALWPHSEQGLLDNMVKEKVEQGMDPTEARYAVQRYLHRGQPSFMNNMLTKLYHDLGGQEAEAIPYYLKDIMADGIEDEDEATDEARRRDINAFSDKHAKASEAMNDPGFKKLVERANNLLQYYGDSGRVLVDKLKGPEIKEYYSTPLDEAESKAREWKASMLKYGHSPEYVLGGKSDVDDVRTTEDYKNAVQYFNDDNAQHLDTIGIVTAASRDKLPAEILPAFTAAAENMSKKDWEDEIAFQQKRIPRLEEKMDMAGGTDTVSFQKYQKAYDEALRKLDEAQAKVSTAPEDPFQDLIDYAKAIASVNNDNPMQFDPNPHEGVAAELSAENELNAKLHAAEEAAKYIAKSVGIDVAPKAEEDMVQLNPNIVAGMGSRLSDYAVNKYKPNARY